jgi:hypothetical protein
MQAIVQDDMVAVAVNKPGCHIIRLCLNHRTRAAFSLQINAYRVWLQPGRNAKHGRAILRAEIPLALAKDQTLEG